MKSYAAIIYQRTNKLSGYVPLVVIEIIPPFTKEMILDKYAKVYGFDRVTLDCAIHNLITNEEFGPIDKLD